MSEEVYTVEQFAERLKLHPKTVLRFIRDGRLRAVKVGKSYRILRSEMEAMTGAVTGGASAIRVTSIVDFPDVDPPLAQQISRTLPSLRMGRETPTDPMSLDIAYDEARRHLKVIIVGAPADTASMLTVLKAIADA
jgi:excisionase family DNA binding protein